MSIICATDFSPGARQAATVAALLAARRERALWLVHRVHPDQLIAAAEPVREGLQALLREEAAALRGLGAWVDVALVEGDSPKALVDFCELHAASLLVVGAPRPGLPFAGAGGSLERLARATSLPLLRVVDAAPFRAWLAGERPLRVMLGVDRTGATREARAWLGALAEYGPLERCAGHVYYALAECQRLGLALPTSVDDVPPPLQGILADEVASLAGFDSTSRVFLCEGMGRAADHLVELAREQEVDLLVMGAHRHTALGDLASVAHHALRLAPMAAAVVPTHAPSAAEVRPLPTVRRLLVATDLSPLSDEAIDFALALAPAGSQLQLVTVQPDTLGPAERREVERKLMLRVQRASEQRDVAVQVQLLTGKDVARTLAQAAERLEADLICVGSRARSGVGAALLGSVAQQLLASSRRPVLVLRPPAP